MKKNRVTIYTASKPTHAPKWRKLRHDGLAIIATWIDYADDGAVVDWQKLWLSCVEEPARANITLLYIEEEETLRGAYVEMGVALANNRRVFIVNPHKVRVTDASHHPLVTCFTSLEVAVEAIKLLSKHDPFA